MTARPLPISLFDSYLKSEFELNPDVTTRKDTLKLYSCGPTVYYYQHIGNIRAAFLPDVISKVAKLSGWQVEWVSNITDVGHLVSDGDEGEDKLEKGAKRENKTPQEIADFYNRDFREQCRLVGIDLPIGVMNPKATEYIKEQMIMALTLLKDGLAYLLEDGIYFDSRKFEEEESKKTDLDKTLQFLLETQKKQRSGNSNDFTGREIANTTKNPGDFALWKFVSVNSLQKWRTRDYVFVSGQQVESPEIKQLLLEIKKKNDTVNYMKLLNDWGCPGWHSECVAMICSILGDKDKKEDFSFEKFAETSKSVIDIHTGGEDHIDIHHKNEILQSEALGFHLSRHWVHNKFVLVDGKKMSKSLGNVYLVKGSKEVTGFESFEERGFDPLAYRLMLMEHHYSEQMNFTWEKLEQSQSRLFNLRKEAAKLISKRLAFVEQTQASQKREEMTGQVQNKIDVLLEPLRQNLNFTLFLETFSKLLTDTANLQLTSSGQSTQMLETFLLNYFAIHQLDLELLNLKLFEPCLSQAFEMAELRKQAKQDKDFAKADKFRADIMTTGWQIDDYPWGYGLWYNPTLLKNSD